MADPVQQETPRMSALKNLAKNLPVANSQVAQGQSAARGMQLQQAVQAAPASTNTTTTAQQIGAQQAQQAGVQQVEAAQKATAVRGPLARMGTAAVQEQAQQGQEKLSSLQAGAREQAMDATQRLAALDASTKKEMYDDQIQFEKDENGRTKFNTIQLADYARLKAENDEQYKNYAQQATQASSRRLQAMDNAYRVLTQQLEQKYKLAEQKKDQDSMRQIIATKQAMEEKIAKEKAKAANTNAMFSTAGTVIGGVIGAVGGGTQGAGVGMAAGGAAGGLAGNQANSTEKQGA